ncbi:MAG: pyroglutamyl-peptidase I [Phycisphaeraceae bacterium]|nr:pyroglutamyl-peptidase I [Phycisphaeraceae bacterium]
MNHPKPIRCLITGFEPFGGSTLNPSQMVIEALAGGEIALPEIKLHTALLPVDTCCVASVVAALWQTHEPDLVLHLGESAKADRLTLERVALNLLDFTIPDNARQTVTDQPIDPAGPAAMFATLPLRALSEKLKVDGIASDLSLSAGAYLCNQTLYLSLGHAQQLAGRAVGFVHVPSLPEQVALGERTAPSMPREQLLEQVQRLIAHAIDLYQGVESDAGH